MPACRHLIAESQVYRYPSERERAMMDENPVDANNHALAALRYLIAEIDARPRASSNPQAQAHAGQSVGTGRERKDDDRLWT